MVSFTIFITVGYKLAFGCSLGGVYNIYAQRDSRFIYPLIISINLACLHDCIKVQLKQIKRGHFNISLAFRMLFLKPNLI